VRGCRLIEGADVPLSAPRQNILTESQAREKIGRRPCDCWARDRSSSTPYSGRAHLPLPPTRTAQSGHRQSGIWQRSSVPVIASMVQCTQRASAIRWASGVSARSRFASSSMVSATRAAFVMHTCCAAKALGPARRAPAQSASQISPLEPELVGTATEIRFADLQLVLTLRAPRRDTAVVADCYARIK
jgi:hypothetical protein